MGWDGGGESKRAKQNDQLEEANGGVIERAAPESAPSSNDDPPPPTAVWWTRDVLDRPTEGMHLLASTRPIRPPPPRDRSNVTHPKHAQHSSASTPFIRRAGRWRRRWRWRGATDSHRSSLHHARRLAPAHPSTTTLTPHICAHTHIYTLQADRSRRPSAGHWWWWLWRVGGRRCVVGFWSAAAAAAAAAILRCC